MDIFLYTPLQNGISGKTRTQNSDNSLSVLLVLWHIYLK